MRRKKRRGRVKLPPRRTKISKKESSKMMRTMMMKTMKTTIQLRRDFLIITTIIITIVVSRKTRPIMIQDMIRIISTHIIKTIHHNIVQAASSLPIHLLTTQIDAFPPIACRQRCTINTLQIIISAVTVIATITGILPMMDLPSKRTIILNRVVQIVCIHVEGRVALGQCRKII